MLRPVNHRIWLQRYQVNELVEIVEWATLKWQQMDAVKLQRNAIDVAGSRQFCNLNVEIGLSAPEWFPLPHQWQLEGKWGQGRWRGRQLYFRGKGGDWWITKRVGNIHLKKGTCEKQNYNGQTAKHVLYWVHVMCSQPTANTCEARDTE